MRSLADDLIDRADADAEQLIGWIRVGIALILGSTVALLVLTAGTLPLAARINLTVASFVILGCFVLGVLSIWLVRSGRYRPWMAWGFGFADITIVSLNLYLATAIPGSNSMLTLAAPPAFLVCLLFVFQSFRYRVALQIVMSVVLVVTVVAIVFMRPEATSADADQRYLESLFGPYPNVARIVLLTLIAALTAFAVWRGRKLLREVATASENRMNATRFLPAELGEDLSDAALADMRKGRSLPLVIMFVDVRGFTGLSEGIGAEETGLFLSDFRALITDSVSERDGVIDKFIGDGALIVFGLKGSLTQASRNALDGATALLLAVETWNRKRLADGQRTVRIVIALHAGDVIAGAIGDMRRLEFSVVGNAVNETSRVETFAKGRDLPLVISAPVLNAAGNPPGWASLGSQNLRGTSAPIELFCQTAVLDSGPAATAAG